MRRLKFILFSHDQFNTRLCYVNAVPFLLLRLWRFQGTSDSEWVILKKADETGLISGVLTAMSSEHSINDIQIR